MTVADALGEEPAEHEDEPSAHCAGSTGSRVTRATRRRSTAPNQATRRLRRAETMKRRADLALAQPRATPRARQVQRADLSRLANTSRHARPHHACAASRNTCVALADHGPSSPQIRTASAQTHRDRTLQPLRRSTRAAGVAHLDPATSESQPREGPGRGHPARHSRDHLWRLPPRPLHRRSTCLRCAVTQQVRDRRDVRLEVAADLADRVAAGLLQQRVGEHERDHRLARRPRPAARRTRPSAGAAPWWPRPSRCRPCRAPAARWRSASSRRARAGSRRSSCRPRARPRGWSGARSGRTRRARSRRAPATRGGRPCGSRRRPRRP